MNAANGDTRRLTYRRLDVVAIPLRRPPRADGAAGPSSGEVDQLQRLRRITRRYTSDRSVESGSSLGWTSMTKAELTAENRPI